MSEDGNIRCENLVLLLHQEGFRLHYEPLFLGCMFLPASYSSWAEPSRAQTEYVGGRRIGLLFPLLLYPASLRTTPAQPDNLDQSPGQCRQRRRRLNLQS